jgi:hypothetical protein
MLGGMVFLVAATMPRLRRKARWGRGGHGPPMSILSILSWGIMFAFVGGGWFLQGIGADIISDGLLSCFAIVGFLFVMLCAIRDSIRQRHVEMANQSPESTLASGATPAGQESRLP